MNRSRACALLAVIAGLALSSPRLTSQDRQAAAPAPAELTREQKEAFLLKAKILRLRSLSEGITNSQRATLSDGRLTHDAHVQTIDEHKTSYQTIAGVELNFRDSYKFNVAAYRLDKLLDLNMVPVSVERKVRGRWAAVTWWVDDVLMTEKQRFLKKIKAPDADRLNDRIYQTRVFTQWVYNTDPNLGNFLITKDWSFWMVDFTRAFRLHKKLPNPEELVQIDRRFYEALRGLEADPVRAALRPLLTNSAIEALLARRDLIVEYFDRLAAEKGEDAVFCRLPGH